MSELQVEEEPWRSFQERDADAILYSSAFRRLRGVTQVIPIVGGIQRNHDRLMHSLKVAQVGVRYARYIQHRWPEQAQSLRINHEAVYAAGLAHDLGHPPFGHVAEKELQAVLEDENYKWHLSDSFEGNAQTFRVLTRLALKRTGSHSTVGLGLSAYTLLACTKYPWKHKCAVRVLGQSKYSENKDYYDEKWGLYDSDELAYRNALECFGFDETDVKKITSNARIMEIADDVTYAIHDVLDYSRINIIPLHEIGIGLLSTASDSGISQNMLGVFHTFDEYAWNALTYKYRYRQDFITQENKQAAVKWLRESVMFPFASFEDDHNGRRSYHGFESTAVQAIQARLSIVDDSVSLPVEVELALEYLKQLTWYFVINHPHLASAQRGQRQIIRDLHQNLCEWVNELRGKKTSNAPQSHSVEVLADSKKHDLKTEHQAKRDKEKRAMRALPPRLRGIFANEEIVGLDEESMKRTISRAVVDFICTLTDAEAVSLHSQLTGKAPHFGEVSWL